MLWDLMKFLESIFYNLLLIVKALSLQTGAWQWSTWLTTGYDSNQLHPLKCWSDSSNLIYVTKVGVLISVSTWFKTIPRLITHMVSISWTFTTEVLFYVISEEISNFSLDRIWSYKLQIYIHFLVFKKKATRMRVHTFNPSSEKAEMCDIKASQCYTMKHCLKKRG